MTTPLEVVIEVVSVAGLLSLLAGGFMTLIFMVNIADCHSKFGQEDVIDLRYSISRGCMVNTKERGWVPGKVYTEQIKPKQITKEK